MQRYGKPVNRDQARGEVGMAGEESAPKKLGGAVEGSKKGTLALGDVKTLLMA